MLSSCWFHLKLLWMVTPRSLALLTKGATWQFAVMLFVKRWWWGTADVKLHGRTCRSIQGLVVLWCFLTDGVQCLLEIWGAVQGGPRLTSCYVVYIISSALVRRLLPPLPWRGKQPGRSLFPVARRTLSWTTLIVLWGFTHRCRPERKSPIHVSSSASTCIVGTLCIATLMSTLSNTLL